MNEELMSTLSRPIGSWWILVPRAGAFYVRIAASGDNYSSYFCSIISSLAHLPFVDMFFELKRINFCCHEIETFFLLLSRYSCVMSYSGFPFCDFWDITKGVESMFKVAIGL